MATASPARRAGSPGPLEHATPEVELVEAQLARGRPEPEARVDPEARVEPDIRDEPDARGEAEPDEEDAYDLDAEPADSDGGDSGDEDFGGGGFGGGGDASGGDGGEGSRGRAVVLGPGSAPAPRAGLRVVHFLQGSWRELQRVQWPDRPQVMQATGVVIGFVIIAGLFLGLSDFVSQRLVNFILR